MLGMVVSIVMMVMVMMPPWLFFLSSSRAKHPWFFQPHWLFLVLLYD